MLKFISGTVIALATGSCAFAAAEPMAFKSVSVELPAGDRMFSGPHADAINNNCLACHSAGMVLTQPKLTKSEWTAEVNKMIGIYKAPVEQGDVSAIVDYLAALPPQR